MFLSILSTQCNENLLMIVQIEIKGEKNGKLSDEWKRIKVLGKMNYLVYELI